MPMLRRLFLMLLAAGTLGCREEVSAPDLEQPLDRLPAGACVVALTSDLANTWERAQAHDAAGLLHRLLTGVEVADASNLETLQDELQAFEAASGVDLVEDLFLNVLGGRATAGIYTAGNAEAPGFLMAAEVEDPARLRRALEALRERAGADWEFEDLDLDGHAVLRMTRDRGTWYVEPAGEVFRAASRPGLLEQAWAVAAGAAPTALSEPVFRAALEALHHHSVVVLTRGDDEARVPWGAQGLTWDPDGVRFRRVVEDARPPRVAVPEETADRQGRMLEAIPAGMMAAYYARPEDASLLHVLLGDLSAAASCLEARHSAAAAAPRVVRVAATTPPLGMSQLPFNLEKDVLPWAGDEMAVVFDEMVPGTVFPMPSAALLVEVADAETARRTLRDLESELARLGGAILGEGFVDVRYGGRTFRSLTQPLMESLSPSWLVDDELAVLTTTRGLMQRIVDTRRTGKRTLRDDATFKPFATWVPDHASAILYVDHRRLLRAVQHVAGVPQLFGHDVTRGLEVLEELQTVLEHFPAGAVYVQRSGRQLSLNGWMWEAR